MKLLLLSAFLFASNVNMVAIRPVRWTNAGIEISALSVETANVDENTVDFLWKVYDDSFGVVDNGVFQISKYTMDTAGRRVADSNFIYYQSNPDSFSLNYVIEQKGFIQLGN